MSKDPYIARLQAKCDAFNALHPVGTDVYLKRDGQDELFATKTRSAAQVLSGHTAVIWLDEVSGCYDLDCVSPMTETHRPVTPQSVAAGLEELLLDVRMYGTGDLPDRVLVAAISRFSETWVADLQQGSQEKMLDAIDDFITRLNAFKHAARALLPVQNGGFGAVAPDRWEAALADADIGIYEAEDLPGHWGFTGCDADQYADFNSALSAALLAHPEVVSAAMAPAAEAAEPERHRE